MQTARAQFVDVSRHLNAGELRRRPREDAGREQAQRRVDARFDDLARDSKGARPTAAGGRHARIAIEVFTE
jgi:hypothetical protein